MYAYEVNYTHIGVIGTYGTRLKKFLKSFSDLTTVLP